MFVIADLCSNIRPFRMPVMFDQEPGTMSAAIGQASWAGADAIKVQVFTRSHFPKTEREAKRADEFPRDLLSNFVEMVHDRGKQAGASVFDEHAVDACFDAGCDFLKIASREAFNMPLVELACDTALPVYTSIPLSVIAPAFREGLPGETFLGCWAEYPALRWFGMDWSSRWLGSPWGWSSHTPHYQDVLGAIDAGASIIEKHLALSPNDPEAAWSLLPQQMKEMVDAIKAA